jgi:hypothetical protein
MSKTYKQILSELLSCGRSKLLTSQQIKAGNKILIDFKNTTRAFVGDDDTPTIVSHSTVIKLTRAFQF